MYSTPRKIKTLKASLPVSQTTQWPLQALHSDTRPCPPTTGKAEREVPTQTSWLLVTRQQMRLREQLHEGSPKPLPWAPGHPGSACTLKLQVFHCPESLGGGPFGPGVFPKRVPAPRRPGSLPGLGASPLPGSRGLVYFQCVRIPVSALPTGGNALKKISVINVVSFVVSHCKGSKREFIFLTCLA